MTAEDGVVQTTASGSGNVAAGTDDDVNFDTSGTLDRVYVHQSEHVINPVLYLEYEQISEADKIMKEVEGHDMVPADAVEPAPGPEPQPARPGEADGGIRRQHPDQLPGGRVVLPDGGRSAG